MTNVIGVLLLLCRCVQPQLWLTWGITRLLAALASNYPSNKALDARSLTANRKLRKMVTIAELPISEDGSGWARARYSSNAIEILSLTLFSGLDFVSSPEL